MAAPARNATTIDVDPGTADMMAQELHEHAERVETEAREGNASRITAARVRNIRRVAGKFERVATAAEADE